MFKTFASACLVLLLAAVLAAAPAGAAQRSGGLGEVDREQCFDELIECVAECTWMDDAGFAECNDDCNGDYGICIRGDGIAHEGTFRPPNRRNEHVMAVGLVGAADLESACTRVDGLFSHSTEMYGCINRTCDAAGSCTLVCTGGNCFAITPGKLPDHITLIGILQNGDGVVKGGAPSGPPQSLSEPGSDVVKPTKGGLIL